MSNQDECPPQRGQHPTLLADPYFERDVCGTGFLADLHAVRLTNYCRTRWLPSRASRIAAPSLPTAKRVTVQASSRRFPINFLSANWNKITSPRPRD